MKKQNDFWGFLNSRGFYTALFTCLFAVLAIAAFVSIRNIDAITKLSTYGENQQEDYLRPAGVQYDTPVSELSREQAEQAGERARVSPVEQKAPEEGRGGTEATSPQSGTQGGVRRVTEPAKAGESRLNTSEKPADKPDEKPAEKQQEAKADEKSQQKNELKTEEKAEEKPEANAEKVEKAETEKEDTKPQSQVKTDTEKPEQPDSKREAAPQSGAGEAAAAPFEGEGQTEWPLDGAIVMDYSVARTIYDKTLDQYRTNPTVSISAEVGTQVKATADGIVKSVSIDPRTGYTVVLEHGGGWQSVYGQLQEAVLVTEGQAVKMGQALGGVGNPTKYGVLLGPHLVFGLYKDDLPQNPKLVLAGE